MQPSSDKNLTAIEKEAIYRQIIEYSYEPTIVHSNYKVLYINKAGAEFFKADKDAIIGASVVDIFTEEYRELITERVRAGTEERKIGELIETAVRRFDGTASDVELYSHPVLFGETEAIQSVIRDLTGHKRLERDLMELKNEIATPIVPVFDGIAVLPLVGSMDGDRCKQLLEIIPVKVQGHHLQVLIIDVSGIYNIDGVVINYLYKINAVLKMLGISPVFTGLRPELAQKAVEVCPDITTLTTKATVKQALRMLIPTK
ncbi:PAS domain S-box protein [Planomicrobium sp. CPCC 101079]|uniref:PAS domain S-box protein n=1 Tax=Planomicrobium sp. CPCC 101079 TaxID=2599618 RepID=UPI0011B8104C|nr:PAS domain S-box protein [Planomicrobium sp. CPCC 101079]TWT13269.1 PAS domain S-box protein [Planomicrobium sp. CPCC 101079]